MFFLVVLATTCVLACVVSALSPAQEDEDDRRAARKHRSVLSPGCYGFLNIGVVPNLVLSIDDGSSTPVLTVRRCPHVFLWHTQQSTHWCQ